MPAKFQVSGEWNIGTSVDAEVDNFIDVNGDFTFIYNIDGQSDVFPASNQTTFDTVFDAGFT